MRKATGACAVVIGLAGLVLTLGGCPAINVGSALGLQDWGRDLLAIPAAVLIGELIDEAQGTNVAIDPNAISQDIQNQLLDQLQGQQGDPGTPGAPGADGTDGTDGQDGKDGVDGTDGTDGTDGQDGKDGVDGVDGESYIAALGCITDEGGNDGGWGYVVKKDPNVAGRYAIAMVGYDFPAGYDPNDLVVLVTPKAIVSQDIERVWLTDAPGPAFGFVVEFRDLWLNRINTEFCFAVYDTSIDPYSAPAAD